MSRIFCNKTPSWELWVTLGESLGLNPGLQSLSSLLVYPGGWGRSLLEEKGLRICSRWRLKGASLVAQTGCSRISSMEAKLQEKVAGGWAS